jgi:hypothetical protein
MTEDRFSVYLGQTFKVTESFKDLWLLTKQKEIVLPVGSTILCIKSSNRLSTFKNGDNEFEMSTDAIKTHLEPTKSKHRGPIGYFDPTEYYISGGVIDTTLHISEKYSREMTIILENLGFGADYEEGTEHSWGEKFIYEDENQLFVSSSAIQTFWQPMRQYCEAFPTNHKDVIGYLISVDYYHSKPTHLCYFKFRGL